MNCRTQISKLAALCAALIMALSARAEEAATVGAGKLKINMLIQPWYVNDSTILASSGAQSFRMRRTEFKVSGSVQEGTRWFFMVDPAKSLSAGAVDAKKDNKIIQDVGVALSLVEGLELIMGQFKVPTIYESALPSGELPLPERSALARTFGERRDPGVMLAYKKGILKANVMLSNGQNSTNSSANANETNASKDVNGRVEVLLLDNSLKIGAFAGSAQIGDATVTTYRNAGGGNVVYALGKLTAGVEYAEQKQGATVTAGWDGEVTYQFHDHFAAALRYDSLSNSTLAFTGEAATAGVSYFFNAHNLKAMLSYTELYNMSGGNGSYTATDGEHGSVTVLMLQSSI